MRNRRKMLKVAILLAVSCALISNRGWRKEPGSVALGYLLRLSGIVFHGRTSVPSGWTRLTSAVDEVRWSKDSRSIYYTGLPSKKVLYRYDLATRKTHQYWLPVQVWQFDVSPDGKSIVTNGTYGQHRAVIVDLESESVRRVIHTTEDPRFVHWLPQDLILVATAQRAPMQGNVFLLTPDRGNATGLLSHRAGNLVCSSDGSGFTYVTWQDNTVYRQMYFDFAHHRTTQFAHETRERESGIGETLHLQKTTLLYQPTYTELRAMDLNTGKSTVIPISPMALRMRITFSPDMRHQCVRDYGSERSHSWLWLAPTPRAALEKLRQFETENKQTR